MNVPTKADLEIRDMADEDFAIFFHEYIHFLQISLRFMAIWKSIVMANI